MLSLDEEDYLSKIPDDKLVFVHPFNPKIPGIAEEITRKIHLAVPDLEIRHMGASSLGISGQGDIDIYIFCSQKDYQTYLPKIEAIFDPKVPDISIIKWAFSQQDHEIEMYLTDPTSPPMQKQIKIFETLKENKTLLDEYKKLKEEMNGKPFKEYQRKKYEFYHRILDS